ncbi:MAG: lipid-A-disaccharide synthase [Pseudomonadota bacterium]
MSFKLMVSAGEASSDLHAANAIRTLQQRGVNPQLFGMGGLELQKLGMRLDVDNRELAVIGIVEVLARYPEFRKKLALLRDTLRAEKPDLLMLVDYPDFNLKLAETAISMNVPVLYYISPQIWAWRSGRIKRIGRLVSHMAVLFPFETKYYEAEQIPVTYVGHPLMDEVPTDLVKKDCREQLEVPQDATCIGLMPGSRRGELKRLLPVLIDSAKHLLARDPSLTFVLPLADALEPDSLDAYAALGDLPVKVVRGKTHEAIKACDAVAVASGTATLEVALLGTPMVIVYKVQAVNYAILSRLVKIPHIGLVNIVAERGVVKELIQAQATPSAVGEELERLLHDQTYRSEVTDALAAVAARMGAPGASARVGDLINRLATDNSASPSNGTRASGEPDKV